MRINIDRSLGTAYFLLFLWLAIPSSKSLAGTGLSSDDTSESYAKSCNYVVLQGQYKLSEVYDSGYGITMYDKFAVDLEGNRIRLDENGRLCQGWISDYYDNNRLLHRGYYTEGKVIIYQNFFPNGQTERSFTRLSVVSNCLQTFSTSGNMRSKVVYHKNNVILWTDYYSNGSVEYSEKYSKRKGCLVVRKSYFFNGMQEETFELLDKKTMEYLKREYYENGAIKKEGKLFFDLILSDYVKNGAWKIYDEAGSLLLEEIYASGARLNSVKHYKF